MEMGVHPHARSSFVETEWSTALKNVMMATLSMGMAVLRFVIMKLSVGMALKKMMRNVMMATRFPMTVVPLLAKKKEKLFVLMDNVMLLLIFVEMESSNSPLERHVMMETKIMGMDAVVLVRSKAISSAGMNFSHLFVPNVGIVLVMLDKPVMMVTLTVEMVVVLDVWLRMAGLVQLPSLQSVH